MPSHHLPDLRPTPPPRFVVNDLLPVGSVALLTGSAKGGKSTFARRLVADLAAGLPFLGRFPTDRADALYVAREGHRGLIERELVSMSGGNGKGIHVMYDLPQMGEGTNVDNDPALSALYDHMDSALSTNLIVVDMLRHLCPRAERAYADDLLAPLRAWAAEQWVSIVLLHHPSTSGKPRGGDGLAGSVDVLWHLDTDRIAGTGTLTVSGRGVRDHRIGLSMSPDTLGWTVVGEDEDFTMPVMAERTSNKAKVRLFLESNATRVLTYEQMAEATGVPHGTIREAVKQMRDNQQVIRINEGKRRLALHQWVGQPEAEPVPDLPMDDVIFAVRALVPRSMLGLVRRRDVVHYLHDFPTDDDRAAVHACLADQTVFYRHGRSQQYAVLEDWDRANAEAAADLRREGSAHWLDQALERKEAPSPAVAREGASTQRWDRVQAPRVMPAFLSTSAGTPDSRQTA